MNRGEQSSRREWLRTLLLVGAASVGIAATRAHLAEQHLHARETSDVFVLPPPEKVVAMSLGYRSALADVLWAQVLVSQGLHLQERRRYQVVSRFIDTINTLDPQFRNPYIFADALITFQAGATTHEEILAVREIMERGTKNLPLDAEIWLDLGSFVSFIAPGSYLTDPAEQKQWRIDGAPYLERAAELAGGDSSIAWRALGGAGLYGRAGERDAEIRFLERACAVTDDPELKIECKKRLGKKLDEAARDKAEARAAAFSAIWKGDVRYVSLARLLLLGPPKDIAYCAGGSHEDAPRCATTWKEWATKIDPTADDLAQKPKP
jgi:hypothetical protein